MGYKCRCEKVATAKINRTKLAMNQTLVKPFNLINKHIV